MNEGSQRNTEINNTDWESELWSYVSQGDGVNCPAYDKCDFRLQGGWCLNEHKDSFDTIMEYVDIEDPDMNTPDIPPIELELCPRNGRMFKLIQQLTYKYHNQAGIKHPPVPSDLITKSEDNLPIEVGQLPMVFHHGAVLKLTNCWLILLNSDDSPARHRFTLYHEIFHILAYEKGTQVSKNTPNCQKGAFNEILADHFAGTMLMPRNMIKPTWDKVRDVDRMAALFGIPKPLVLAAARYWNLK